MGVGLQGTIAGTGTTGVATGQNFEVALDFSGAATIDVERQMPSGNWVKILTGLTADALLAFNFGSDTSIRLNCTAFTNAVEFKIAPTKDPFTIGGAPGSAQSPIVNAITPANGTPVQASSANVANAAAVATLPAVVGRTNWLSGFQVTGSGATAGLPVTVTVAGLLGGTANFTYTFATGVAVANQPLIVGFYPPVPASAPNVAIVVTCPASGAGGTNNTVAAQGFVV